MRRLAYERQQRDWSTSEVARRLTDAGFKINQSSVWSIESDPRRKITFAEAMAFADLYGLSLDQLTQVPRDITGKEVEALLKEATSIRRDGNQLLARLVALLEKVRQFDQAPEVPQQVDALFEYLGISEFGMPLEKLKAKLAAAGQLALDLAETLPEEGIVLDFDRDES